MSTPKILIRSGTGFHNVCHDRCRSLEVVEKVSKYSQVVRVKCPSGALAMLTKQQRRASEPSSSDGLARHRC